MTTALAPITTASRATCLRMRRHLKVRLGHAHRLTGISVPASPQRLPRTDASSAIAAAHRPPARTPSVRQAALWSVQMLARCILRSCLSAGRPDLLPCLSRPQSWLAPRRVLARRRHALRMRPHTGRTAASLLLRGISRRAITFRRAALHAHARGKTSRTSPAFNAAPSAMPK